MCIIYDIPKIEIHGKKKLSRKGKLGRGEPVAGKAPSDRSLTSGALGLPDQRSIAGSNRFGWPSVEDNHKGPLMTRGKPLFRNITKPKRIHKPKSHPVQSQPGAETGPLHK
jgi:hypothetical protein